MRAAVDLEKFGARTICVDCDVLQADGGTRTAAITGAFVALSLAVKKLMAEKKLAPARSFPASPPSASASSTAAVAGFVLHRGRGRAVDMNLVMNSAGEFIELQGTGEEATFTEAQLADLLALGKAGIRELLAAQEKALAQG
jgi:ribonuclease PH